MQKPWSEFNCILRQHNQQQKFAEIICKKTFCSAKLFAEA